MELVERSDRRLLKLPKPELRSWSPRISGTADTLVVCAGFEDRATYSLEELELEGTSVVMISYEPDVEENRTKYATELCEKKGASTKKYVFNRYDPIGFGEEIVDQMDIGMGRIYLDISGMSRILIVQFIVALAEAIGNLQGVTILYSEALEYPPSVEEFHKRRKEKSSIYDLLFLSEGVYDVSVLPELTTSAFYSQPVHLVAFPSFNKSQLIALLGELQPAAVSLIHGLPPVVENQWRLQAIKDVNDVDSLKGLRAEYTASTLDYRKTFDILLEHYEEYGVMHRLVISPTGSKMQAVAVGILKTFMTDVQVVYPTPRTFVGRSKYTLGVRQSYMVDLDSIRI